jgi:hypothetical protein
MFYRQIEAGMVLRLKRSRMDAYGSTSPYVLVTGIKPHPRYKVPWILSGADSYKPADFQSAVNPNDTELITAVIRKSQNKEQTI